MGVEVKFGNLGIDAIERDLGIKFTEEDRKLLQETRQETVMVGNEKVKMPSRSWHFFDIPRQLELGSYGFFLEIRKMLSRYKLKGNLAVNFVFSGINRVKPWNGEQLKDIDKKYWELKYSELEEELKDYKKHLKELKAKVQ